MLPAVVIGIGAFVASCSSGQVKTSQGSLSVKLGLSRPVAGAPASVAANVTVSEIEARRADGTWVPSESNPPVVVDLVSLNSGGAVTLPPHFMPEGQYGALQVRFSRVELTLQDGTRVPLAPPATGWAVLVPLDFSVVGDESTIVALNVRSDTSFKRVGGRFEFEPELEPAGVEHE
jgi:hypothetical protein